MSTSISSHVDRIEKSTVQILADHFENSYATPWVNQVTDSSTSTGFCVMGTKGRKYIITNAHAVHNSGNIRLRKRSTTVTHRAVIFYILYECDLALLELEKHDAGFWTDMEAVEFAEGMPSKLDTVYVVGYPLHGSNPSITSGVVNRIQLVKYFDVVLNVALQVDAAINFGNSGGPVVNEHFKVVGIAFAGEPDSSTQNMGYIIPNIIVKYFMDNAMKNEYPGLASLDIEYQSLYNNTMRQYLELPEQITGVVVTYVGKFGSSIGILEKLDVITRVNNVRVDNDGMVLLGHVIDAMGSKQDHSKKVWGSDDIVDGGKGEFVINSFRNELVGFMNMISLMKHGEVVKLEIFRKGKLITLTVKLEPKKFIIPILSYHQKPSYYILYGLVFVPLNYLLYLEKKGLNERVRHLVDYMNDKDLTFETQQVIILSQILQPDASSTKQNMVLKSVNEIEIVNLKHLRTVVTEQLRNTKFLNLQFRDSSYIMILSSASVLKNQKKIIAETVGNISEFSE